MKIPLQLSFRRLQRRRKELQRSFRSGFRGISGVLVGIPLMFQGYRVIEDFIRVQKRFQENFKGFIQRKFQEKSFSGISEKLPGGSVFVRIPDVSEWFQVRYRGILETVSRLYDDSAEISIELQGIAE